MSDIINTDSESIKSFISAIDSISKSMDNVLENYRPILDGKRFITEGEVSSILHISKRTLHDYRSQNKIPYYQIGGKILYDEADIEHILENGYKKTFD